MPPTKKRMPEEEDEDDLDARKKRSKGATRSAAMTSSVAAAAAATPVGRSAPSGPKHKFARTHQLLLQTMLIRKAMTLVEMDQLLAAILKETKEGATSLSNAVASINAMLNDDSGAFHMSIKQRMSPEENGTTILALVNTRNDAISKISTPFEDWHLNMFKLTLGLIANSDNGYVGHSEILNAFKQEGKKGGDIHTVLNRLTGLGWLAENPQEKNTYTAGRRTLIELSDTLRDLGAVECPMSRQPVVRTPLYQAWLAQRTGGGAGTGAGASTPA